MHTAHPVTQALVATAIRNDDVAVVIHALLLTTIEPFAGWPGCEKVVHESRQPRSYHEFVRAQRRASATVQFMMRGSLLWRVGDAGAWGRVEPGQALVFDAGVHGDLEYQGDPDGGHLEFVYANLLGETMRQAVQGITARAGHAVPAPGAEELVKRWSTRLSGSEDASAHRCLSAVETSELAWSFLHPLARGLAPGNRLAERAMAMLTENWQDPPQLSVLARRLLVSREHLSRVLRTTCGQPPALWLRRYRVDRAADMLLSGQTIQQAARASGFCSAPHFIHAFRRVHGTTPGRWLRGKQA